MADAVLSDVVWNAGLCHGGYGGVTKGVEGDSGFQPGANTRWSKDPFHKPAAKDPASRTEEDEVARIGLGVWAELCYVDCDRVYDEGRCSKCAEA